MTAASSDRERLAWLLRLVDREDRHLLAVRKRLLGADCGVDGARLQALVADDLGIDRLESFGAKFSRMQDTVVDKLVPTLLQTAGERSGAAIDNLMRLERFELVSSADEWIAMRGLRNRLVHEYIDRPDDLATALERACRFTDRMHADYAAIRAYAIERLGVESPDGDA